MKKMTLLYAEDAVETRKNHIQYLNKNYDFNIIEASDGVEAFELYLTHKPEVLLTDITMPHMDGLELVEKIREVDGEIKIIILSAHSDEKKLLRAMELKLSSYQIKPIDRKKLNDAIFKVLNSIEKKDEKTLCYFNINCSYDIFYKKLMIENEEIKLSKYETLLLDFLIKNKNRQIKIEDLHNHIWDDFSIEYSPTNVRTLVKKLRKKLPDNSITTLYGGGYKLVLN